MNPEIIDVSKHNGNIDWAAIKKEKITRVIIRLSLGYNTVDSKADEHIKNAFKNGFKVSYYHFAYPDSKPGRTHLADATQEAEYFVGLVNLYKVTEGITPELLAVDFEPDTNTPGWGNGQGDTNLNAKEYNEWILKFYQVVYDKLGIIPLLYGAKFYLESKLPANHKLGSLPLWIANYDVTKPSLPKGWSEYYLWQYTKKGNINGKEFDFNIFMHRLFLDDALRKIKEK